MSEFQKTNRYHLQQEIYHKQTSPSPFRSIPFQHSNESARKPHKGNKQTKNMIRIQQKLQYSFPWYTLNHMETDSDFDPNEYVSMKLQREYGRKTQKKSTSSSETFNSNSTLTSTASPGSVTSHLSQDDNSNDDDPDNIYTITRLIPSTTKQTRNGYHGLSIASRFQIMREAFKRRRWKRPKTKKKIVFPSFELTILRHPWGSKGSDYDEPDDNEDGIFIVFEDNSHQLKANLL